MASNISLASPHQAVLDACDFSAKHFARLALKISEESRRIQSMPESNEKRLAAKELFDSAIGEKNFWEEKVENLRQSKKSSDPTNRTYYDVYYSFYRNTMVMALALGMDGFSGTETSMKLKLERECLASAR
jgi:hypothetical protein